MNCFNVMENEGRNLLTSFLKDLVSSDHVEFTEDRYNPVDVFFTFQNDKKAVGEIKVRAKKY